MLMGTRERECGEASGFTFGVAGDAEGRGLGKGLWCLDLYRWDWCTWWLGRAKVENITSRIRLDMTVSTQLCRCWLRAYCGLHSHRRCMMVYMR
jgi:hypothetical protein